LTSRDGRALAERRIRRRLRVVIAKIDSNNTVIAARRAGITDHELAAVGRMPESETLSASSPSENADVHRHARTPE
jgi:hypothetical protein